MIRVGPTTTNLVQQWQFGVEIQGFIAALFTKVDLPEVEFDEVTFSPAGSTWDQKLPGRVKFNDIVLEKGVTAEVVDQSVYKWLTQQVNFNGPGGLPPRRYLRDISIVEFDRDGTQVRRWNVYGAWVKKYTPGSREGGKSDNAIEQITLAYQYYQLV